MDTLIYFFAVLGVVFFAVLIILAAMYVAGEIKNSMRYRKRSKNNITRLIDQMGEIQCGINDIKQNVKKQ
ncbi:MAG: hypothetical protein LUI12_05265 [Clostridiales bacterium]|nr:hypothetical protein [Clostridiales bacterium]